jgi:hypothetical protein
MTLIAGCSGLAPAVAQSPWRELAPGLDLAEFPLSPLAEVDDSTVVILRIDTAWWDFRLCCASEIAGDGNLTARQWCERRGLAAAINAGMFATDYETHVGYLRTEGHVNSARSNDYQSVAAFSPRNDSPPHFRIYDLDAPGMSLSVIDEQYDAVAQNLRLIKRPRLNRWSSRAKRWSEAALGEDAEGRALFIFCRSPCSMPDLNEALLALPIGLQCAQHLEGGLEAQLYVKIADIEIELVGSHDDGFHPDSRNRRAWPVPNVIGLASRR